MNKLAFLKYDSAEVFPRGEEFNIGDGKQFRFIGAVDRSNFLISSLRLRYRPHDHDSGIGMRQQEMMVLHWAELISELE